VGGSGRATGDIIYLERGIAGSHYLFLVLLACYRSKRIIIIDDGGGRGGIRYETIHTSGSTSFGIER